MAPGRGTDRTMIGYSLSASERLRRLTSQRDGVCVGRAGNPTTVTFKDYLLPTIADVPDFEYVHICTPSKAEGGFRGVGKGGIVGPPTLVNAIADALALLRCLDLPLTPSRILHLIEGRDARNKAPSEAVFVQAEPDRGPVVEAQPDPAGVPPRFVTEDDQLSGTLDSDIGSQDFTGTVEDNRLSWTMKVSKTMPLTLRYDIQVDGSRLTGKAKMGIFGTAKLTGERL